MSTATKRLQSKSDAVFIVTDEIWALCDRTKLVVTEATNLKQWVIELEVELHQSSKHVTAAKRREDTVRKELTTVKEELAASRVKCAS